jgi:hypothetical protein
LLEEKEKLNFHNLQGVLTCAKITPYPNMKSNGLCFPKRLQLHGLEVLGDLEGSGSLAADLLDGDALGVLDQGQTLGGADVEDGEIGDDGRDTAGAGQGEGAV